MIKHLFLFSIILIFNHDCFSQNEEFVCLKILNECISGCDENYIEFQIENNTSDSIVLFNKFFKAGYIDKEILYPNSSDRSNIILFTNKENRYMEFSGEYLPDYSKESHAIIITPYSKVKFFSEINLDSNESKRNNWNLKYFFKFAKLNKINELIFKNNFIFSETFFIILENNDEFEIGVINYNSKPNPDKCKRNYNINFLKPAFDNLIQLCR